MPADLIDAGPALPDTFSVPPTVNSLGERIPKKKVALYNGGGTWALGLNHTKKLLRKMNIPYSTVSTRDIQSGKLSLTTYDMLVMSGGKSWVYLDNLKETGAKAIRDFIHDGGGYYGTCAGAFFATSRRTDARRNDVPYGIGLLDGTAYDGTSMKTAPFKSGEIKVDYHLQGLKSQYTVLLLGGPALLYSADEAAAKNIQELATFPGFNKPAMITFNYGQGRVMLAGPHGEIEESRVFSLFKKTWKDPDSEWPILAKVIRWLRKEAPHPALK